MSLANEDGNSKLVEVAFLDWNQIVNLSTAGKGCQNLDRWSDRVSILFRFCMYNELSFSLLMAPVEKYMRRAYLVNHIIYGRLFTRAISFRPENIEYNFI